MSELASIELAELIERAALQTRIDRKYVLSLAKASDFLHQLQSRAQVLEIDGMRSFSYESVYFDTSDLVTYLLAARRRRRRFKVRTRTYLDSYQCWLEVKTRGARGRTVKHRLPYQPHHRSTLAPGRRFVSEVLEREQFAVEENLIFLPTLVSRYRRSTLFLPASASRVTVDTDLTWETDQRELYVPEMVIIETKTGSTASDVDRMLWHSGHRPTRISKYATGLAALRPELPSTRWRRTLRRHFVAHQAAVPHPFHWQCAS